MLRVMLKIAELEGSIPSGSTIYAPVAKLVNAGRKTCSDYVHAILTSSAFLRVQYQVFSIYFALVWVRFLPGTPCVPVA